MTKGITGKEPDPRVIYADIIDHPHWQSKTHPHMSLYDRAAQFSPFAALTGYDDMVSEEARIVDKKIELEESELERLSRKLAILNDAVRKGAAPTAAITYFIPDPLKSGGKYETAVEQIKKIDAVRGKVVLMRTSGYGNLHVEIDMKNILEIHGESVDDSL